MADTPTPVDSSLPGLLSTGIQFGLNQSLQNKLLQSSIDNLTQFAQSVDAQKYPNLLAEINNNINLAQQGKISPAQMLAAVQQKSNLLGVKVPPQFTDSVNSALAQEAQVAKQGYTPVERSAIQNALSGVINQQKGEEAAIGANQQARGQYGGGQALDQETTALQGEINNASSTANQTQANAYQRALAALQNEGQLGLAGGQQSFGQQATVAGAQDAINQLNTTLQQQANTANMQANNAAIQQTAAQELAREQANQQAQLSLNQQRTGAQNQNVQNEQQGENIAVGALKQAGQDAASLAPTVYKNAQAGQSTLAQQLLGPTGALSGAVSGAGKLIGGILGGSGSGSGSGSGTPPSSGGGTVPPESTGPVPLPPDNSGGGGSDTGGGSYDDGSGGGYAFGGEIGVDGGIRPYQMPTLGAPVENTSNSDILGGILNQINGREVRTTAAPLSNTSQNALEGAFNGFGGFGEEAPQRVARNTMPSDPQGPGHVFNIDGPRAQPHPRMTTQPVGGNMNRNAMYSSGGDVHGPGTETSDSIPVRLSNHEYVVNAESTKKYKPMLEAINNDDHAGILDSLMSICGPSKDCEVVVTGKGKKIDGQKALSDALRAMSKGSDE